MTNNNFIAVSNICRPITLNQLGFQLHVPTYYDVQSNIGKPQYQFAISPAANGQIIYHNQMYFLSQPRNRDISYIGL